MSTLIERDPFFVISTIVGAIIGILSIFPLKPLRIWPLFINYFKWAFFGWGISEVSLWLAFFIVGFISVGAEKLEENLNKGKNHN